MESREQHQSAIDRHVEETTEALRKCVQTAQQEARQRHQRTFSIPLPTGAPAEVLETITHEAEVAGWTVSRSKQHTDHYLNFS